MSSARIVGADVSSVRALEDSGVVFRDADGRPGDLFELLHDAGFTDVRLRVWNDPFDAAGRGYGGGTVDAARAVELGRRATDAGLRVLVDFHYSDFWADPGKQFAPKAWAGFDLAAKAEALGAYTRESLTLFRDAGVDVRLVQVGNETNDALAGETGWDALAALLNTGAAAVRDILPEALVAVHVADPQTPGRYRRYARELVDRAVDADVFATSYYPFWHGTPRQLVEVLREVIDLTGWPVLVMETAWPRTPPRDEAPADAALPVADTGAYEVSVNGQVAAFADVAAALDALGDRALGAVYWEPAWLPVGRDVPEAERRERWETHGSGWASSAAGEYLPEARDGHGGSQWSAYALFADDGRALPSLEAFARLVGART